MGTLENKLRNLDISERILGHFLELCVQTKTRNLAIIDYEYIAHESAFHCNVVVNSKMRINISLFYVLWPWLCCTDFCRPSGCCKISNQPSSSQHFRFICWTSTRRYELVLVWQVSKQFIIIIIIIIIISKNAKAWYGKLDLPDNFESIQLSAILGTTHLLRKVLSL